MSQRLFYHRLLLCCIIILCSLVSRGFSADTSQTPQKVLRFAIIAPTNNCQAQVGEILQVMIASNLEDVASVVILCDDRGIAMLDKGPFQAKLDTSSLAVGSHVLKATACLNDGRQFTTHPVTLVVLPKEEPKEPPSPNPPAPVSPAPPTPPPADSAGPAVVSPTSTTAELAKKWSGSVVMVRLLDENRNEIGLGSGFVIAPELVATCFHVVAGSNYIEVKTADRILFPATEVAAADRERDLAIIRVKNLQLPVMALGDSAAVQPGESVIAMGSPLGYQGSISEGIVSGLRDLDKFGEVLQISAPISPGNSGGPLINYQGQVVGVSSLSRIGAQNINFGVPVNALKELMLKLQNTSQSSDTSLNLNPPKEAEKIPLTEVGLLPYRKGSMELTIPRDDPYAIALMPNRKYRPESVCVSLGKKQLEQVKREEALVPDSFLFTSLGVLKFHASAKRKKVTVSLESRPRRILVYANEDVTGGDMIRILKDRIPRLGDEVFGGPEADMLVVQWKKQGGETFRELAALTNCSQAIFASFTATMSDAGYGMYGPTQYYIKADVHMKAFDLNTGQQVYDQDYYSTGTVGMLAGWRKFRRGLGENCVDAILGTCYMK
jgi:S1-C subfamily serine protease